MPKQRPRDVLRRLGNRIRARRKYLKRTRVIVAKEVRISVAQLQRYESGEGHPPAFTLSRIAGVLGTTSSALLGEDGRDASEEITAAVRLYADPAIGAVIRHMGDMTPDQRKHLHAVAVAFVTRTQAIPQKVEVMTA